MKATRPAPPSPARWLAAWARAKDIDEDREPWPPAAYRDAARAVLARAPPDRHGDVIEAIAWADGLRRTAPEEDR